LALRETRPKHREKPHKLLQVGVTPTPATSLRSRRKHERRLPRRSSRRSGTKAGRLDIRAASYGSAGQFQGSDPAARL
jgi:hypothetical protein